MKLPRSRKNSSIIFDYKDFITDLKSLIPGDSAFNNVVLENLADGRWVWDLDNIKYKWSSKKFWNALGYDYRDQSLSVWCETLQDSDFDKCVRLHSKFQHDHSQNFDEIFGFKDYQGNIVYFRMLGTVMEVEGSGRRLLIGSYTNVNILKNRW